MGKARRGGARGKAAPKVVVDKGLRARWQDTLARYRTARTAETAGWDDRYEALGEFLDSDPPYYLAGGYKNARELPPARFRVRTSGPCAPTSAWRGGSSPRTRSFTA